MCELENKIPQITFSNPSWLLKSASFWSYASYGDTFPSQRNRGSHETPARFLVVSLGSRIVETRMQFSGGPGPNHRGRELPPYGGFLASWAL